MDSHETVDSKLLRNINAITTKSVSDNTIDAAAAAATTADSCAILNSSANTNLNDYKGNDVNTVQPANHDHNVPDNSTQSHQYNMHQSKVPHTTATATTRSTTMTSDIITPFASTSDQVTTVSDISSTTATSLQSSTSTSALVTTTSLSVRKSKQRKSDSSSSSPNMSPSYIQNKQYRTNTPRNVDLIDNVMHSNDNKENVPGIHAQYSTPSEQQQQQHRLDSPKFALQQNSPNTPLSSYKSPPSTHSSPMYTAHEPRSDCNIFTYSPLITEPFKNSTYFHFPDVDTPSPIAALATSQEASRAHLQLSSTLNNNNLIITSDEKKSNQSTLINNNNNNNYNRSNHSSHNIQIVTSDECCSTTTPKIKAKEAAVRRARLKSISLDSDGARLVEENLCIPVEELMERALKQHTNKTSFDEDSTPFHSPANLTSDEHRSHTKCLSKNYNHLVLDLSIKDDSLSNVDYQSSPSGDTKDERFQFNLSKSKSTTPKTPTLTQTRHAVSLDSDPNFSGGASSNASHELGMHHQSSVGSGTGMRTKPHLLPNFLCVESNASMSVPTTPRRQQIVKNTLTKFSGTGTCGGGGGGIGKGMTGNRKSGFASSAEYFASKKAAERKCNEKLQLNPENEPILEGLLEGSVVDYYDDVYTIEHDATSSFETSTDDVDCDIICGSANSLISHCGGGGSGSGGGGDGNSGINNNLSSLNAGNFLGLGGNSNVTGLSLSNYSLSNFQGSHCSLARSNHNIYGMTSPANPCSQNHQNVPMMAGVTTANSFSAASMQSQRQVAATGASSGDGGGGSVTGAGASVTSSSSTSAIGTRSIFCTKKNLLQRRGSNTSLTLNIVGGTGGNSSGGGGGGGAPIAATQTTLNRFNSHNSLNVMSTPFETQRANNTIATTKKGLLERRNSNASLTLQLECRSNIQKRALSTSNCYLRGSDLSLSSSNNFESHLEDQHRVCTMCGGGGIIKKNAKRSTSASAYNSDITNRHRQHDQAHHQTESYAHETEHHQQKSSHQMDYVDISSGSVGIGISSCSSSSSRLKSNRSGRRKFFSSENLNIHNTFSLSQPPIKTSSVVDLNQANAEMDDVYDDDQNTLCPCSSSVIRNISTKPLSPQTTSEDFKIYLANIQILQNASNVLTDNKLTTLTNVFKRSYGRSTNVMGIDAANAATTTDGGGDDDVDDADKPCTACETCTLCKTCKICLTKCRCEQNCLLTNLHQEFWDLPTNYQEKPLVFGSQVKNRYKTILPNEHSRVILDAEFESNTSDSKEQQPISDLYINANFIKGPDYTHNSYIATQGPMSNTIYDFWLMVYQNYNRHLKTNKSNVDALPFQQKIAMLTDIIENDESKCAIYFPQNVGKFLCFLSNDERRQKDYQQSQALLDAYMAEHELELFDLAQPNEILTEIIVDNRCPSNGNETITFPSTFNFNFFAVKTMDCLNKGGYTIRKFHCLYHTCKLLDKRSNGSEIVIETAAAAAAPEISELKTTDDDSFERKVHTFVVYHYWFPHWPDHRSPENIDTVLDMCINLIDSDCEQELLHAHDDNDLLRVNDSLGGENVGGVDLVEKANGRQSMDLSNSQPLMLNHVPFNGPTPIIHCSAGIGRTGCVAAILNGLRQLRLSYLSSSTSSSLNATDTTIKHASVDILGIVSNLRLQRGGMVQNSEQYELIHRALCLYHQRYLSK